MQAHVPSGSSGIIRLRENGTLGTADIPEPEYTRLFIMVANSGMKQPPADQE